jgi:hypothetical protein
MSPHVRQAHTYLSKICSKNAGVQETRMVGDVAKLHEEQKTFERAEHIYD